MELIESWMTQKYLFAVEVSCQVSLVFTSKRTHKFNLRGKSVILNRELGFSPSSLPSSSVFVLPVKSASPYFNNKIVIQVQVFERWNVHKRGLQESIYSVVIQTDDGQTLEVPDGQSNLGGIREVIVGENDLRQLR
jgi:hypothetical protein